MYMYMYIYIYIYMFVYVCRYVYVYTILYYIMLCYAVLYGGGERQGATRTTRILAPRVRTIILVS